MAMVPNGEKNIARKFQESGGVTVLRSIRHRKSHFGDVLPSLSLGLVLKKLQ